MPPAVTHEKLSRHQQHYHYALPTYGEYVVDSPSVVSISTSSAQAFDSSAIRGSFSTTTTATSAAHTATGAPLETENIVFCDPIAFRYLEEDACATVVLRNRQLNGYEVYLVEQWTCSRTAASFVISTYTGDPSHRITVSVLRIPRDENFWSPRLKVYFKAVREYNARAKETELGTLMVTNLSNFPSALTVVLVPGGDVRNHRLDFIVNEDLKRMGCSGRSALSLAPPTDATQTKFYQMYKVNSGIDFNTAVMELVRTCQIALLVFGKFPDTDYLDGLLCDVTEKCIRDWWAEFGIEEYDVEPIDGTLGPTTVAGLLGMLLGARTRLAACGAPVPKDAFDLPQLVKAITYFQRSHRLDRTGRLDRTTLTRLRRVTSRDSRSGSGSDIFAVPRAIRSTMADLGARAVGGSANQVDPGLVETVNIDRFIEHISGETCKFLWHGKPKKNNSVPLTSTNASRRNSASASGEDQVIAPTNGSDAIVAAVGAISSAPISTAALHQHMDSITPPSGTTPAKTHTGFSSREGSGGGSSASGVFRSVTGRMKKAGAEFRSARSQHQTIINQRSIPKDLHSGYQASPPRTATPPLAVVTAPSSPKLQPSQSQPQLVGPTSNNSNNPPPFSMSAPELEFSQSQQSEDTRQASDPTAASTVHQPLQSQYYSQYADPQQATFQSQQQPPGRPPLPSLRRPSLQLPPVPHHDEYFPRRLSFSLALDALSTTAWTLPFSPPSPPLSPPHLATITWAEHHLSILTSRTHTLSAEADALENEYHEAENEVREIEDAKCQMLRAVEEAEVAVGGCRYETAMTEAKVRDLGEAVSGVARKVREVEKEWKEVEEERGGKKGRKIKPKPGDAGVEAVRWRAEDGVKGGLFW